MNRDIKILHERHRYVTELSNFILTTCRTAYNIYACRVYQYNISGSDDLSSIIELIKKYFDTNNFSIYKTYIEFCICKAGDNLDDINKSFKLTEENFAMKLDHKTYKITIY